MTNHSPATEETKVAPTAGPEDQNSEDNAKKGARGGRSQRKRNDTRIKEAKEFEEAILQIDRVTRVVAGGRRLRFRISVIIGDQKGRVGFALGKSAEVMIGIQKAVFKAKKNLLHVPITEDTIPHTVDAKFKASKVILFPAPEGTGIIAGGAVRKILELAGAKNVLSKIHGSRNRINVACATLLALEKLQDPKKRKKLNIKKSFEEKDEEQQNKKIII